jgi:hypothetical protein
METPTKFELITGPHYAGDLQIRGNERRTKPNT